MTGSKPPRGFARQLLARADGTLPSPPPRTRPYFSAENGRTDPVFGEITREAQPRLMAPQEALHRSPIDPAVAPAQSDPPVARSHQAQDTRADESRVRLDDEFRLAAPVRTRRNSSTHEASFEADSDVGPAGHSAQGPTDTVRVDHPRAESDAAKRVASPVDRPIERRASRHEQTALRPPDLQAAIAQLLGGTTEAAPAPPVASSGATTPPPRNEPKVEAENTPATSNEALTDTDAQPITIHIGEIVVAPENPPPTATHKRQAWTPPVSIDEYRARRAKEWG